MFFQQKMCDGQSVKLGINKTLFTSVFNSCPPKQHLYTVNITFGVVINKTIIRFNILLRILCPPSALSTVRRTLPTSRDGDR